MTNREIAAAFSNGEFEKAYPSISDNAEWIVIEEGRFTGKRAILDQCERVGGYFKSVTTNFKTSNIIDGGNRIAINGTAEFLRDNKRISLVSSCDVYEFNEKGEIQRITSYCIPSK